MTDKNIDINLLKKYIEDILNDKVYKIHYYCYVGKYVHIVYDSLNYDFIIKEVDIHDLTQMIRMWKIKEIKKNSKKVDG